MMDTVNEPAGGLLLGPKFDFAKYFSLGVSLGTFIRPDKYYSSISLKVKGVQIIPMGGVTASFHIPIYRNISLETNMLFNGIINHGVSGIRFDF